MTMSREQFQQQLKQIAVEHAREILANQDENRRKAVAAKRLFEELRDAPTWTIAQTQKPEGFEAPSDELWTQKCEVVDRRKADDNAGD
jgi:hypothetical protein